MFGQDLLLLKSGKFNKGIFIGKEGENIIFTIKGDSVHSQFSINDIDIIKTNNGEYFYPFDIPSEKLISKIDIPSEKLISKNTKSRTLDFNTLPKKIISKQEIVNMSEEEKGFLYGKYKINPFGNTLISVLIPTLGYYRINQWKQRGRNCIYIYFGMFMAIEVANFNLIDSLFNPKPKEDDGNEMLDSFVYIYRYLYAFDVFIQTNKYNRNLYKYIFD